ncbi:MAG: hypothetical protein QM541_14415 [Flavobacterium sp.]|nr:hypothetical protein [Flavobacterium sp.]
MSVIFRNIKDFIFNFNGILLPKDRFIDEELNDIYFKVFSTNDRLEPYNDKINIKNDIFNVRNDFRKSIKEYKNQHKVAQPSNG